MTSTGEAVEMCSLSLCAGKNVAIDVVSAEADMEGAAEEVSSMLEVALPAGQRSGVVHFEVARGALLSGPKVPPYSHRFLVLLMSQLQLLLDVTN